MEQGQTIAPPLKYRIRRFKPAIMLAVALLLIGGAGFFVVERLKQNAAQIVEDTLPGLVYAGQINSELSENFARTLLVINTDSEETRTTYLQRIAEGSQRVNASMKSYEESIYEAEDRVLFQRLMAAREQYREIRGRVFALVKENHREDGLRLFETELLPAYAAQKEVGEALFDYNVKQGHQRGIQIELVCRRTQWTVTSICIILFVGGFFTPFLAIRLPPTIWK